MIVRDRAIGATNPHTTGDLAADHPHLAPDHQRASRPIPQRDRNLPLDLASRSPRKANAISVGWRLPPMEDEADSDGSAGDDASELPDAKYHQLQDRYADVDIGGLPPIAPDGGFVAVGPIGVAPAVPAATPERFICLRGPCVHYWQREAFFGSGNPEETWGDDGLVGPDGAPVRQPRQIDRTCLAQPGMETELTDELVYLCNRWTPMTPRQKRKRDRAWRRYYKNYPHHDPSFVPAERLRR